MEKSASVEKQKRLLQPILIGATVLCGVVMLGALSILHLSSQVQLLSPTKITSTRLASNLLQAGPSSRDLDVQVPKSDSDFSLFIGQSGCTGSLSLPRDAEDVRYTETVEKRLYACRHP